jgi:hypothetical protein
VFGAANEIEEDGGLQAARDTVLEAEIRRRALGKEASGASTGDRWAD